MIYTLIGLNDYVEIELNKLLKDIPKENIEIYDIEKEDVNISDIIINLDTVSLLGLRAFVIYNINKLDDYDKLIRYINNPGSDILIFVSFNELDKRKKITKVLEDKTKIINLLDYNLFNYIKNNLEDYTMSFKDVNLLISYCDNNIFRVIKELEKLKLYKLSDKVITGNDIEKLVRKSYDSTIFNLIDCINTKDVKKIRKIYDELLFLGDTDDKIMYTIANHYRLLYQVSVEIETMSEKDILEKHKMHPYRFKKLKEQLNMISVNEILNILKKLSDIDIKCKMGNTDLSTEMFLFFERL